MSTAAAALPQQQESPSLEERLRAFRRRRRPLAVVLAGGIVLTLALALLLPPTYRATGTILIEQQEIPQDVVRSTISSFADQRIQVISQRVMTSHNLLAIADKYDLYPWQRRTRPREVVIQKMRNDIQMRLISANVIDPRSGRPTQATIAFSVSFDAASADVAVRAANDITSLYLNENITTRAKAAEQASTFLAEEAGRLSTEIQRLGAQLAEFKEKNSDSLPDLSGVNFQLLDRTELDLRDLTTHIGTIDGQKAFIEAQLATMSPTSQMYTETGQRVLSPADRLKTLKADLASLRARYAPTHPDVVKTEREVAGLQAEVGADESANDLLRQLEQARTELAAAKERYAPTHPDVVRLERIVSSTEQQIAAMPRIERVRTARTNPDNPAYIQLRAQLESLLADRSSALEKQELLRTRLDELRRRLALAPAVEKEFRSLTQDLTSAQLKYQEVRAKQMEAELSQNLETERKGERFTLIEPPLPPQQPVSPNRPLVLALGLLGSIVLALGVVFAGESLDSSVRSARELRALVEVAPLATIPLIRTDAEIASRRRVLRWSGIGAAVALVVAVVGVHFFFRPLDVLWFGLLRRLGV